ncbi:MAG: DNA polymerase III subunit delta [Bacteroidetes bacterium]|nr:MAG: DNA polymerase III subunit delta [Bacteroidota bacterium]
MRFSDIHGLELTKKQLITSVQRNQVAHAQLFSGVEGSALLPMALAYATYLNCTNPTDEDACGECSSCSKNAKFVHPDVHFVYPVSSTEKITGKDVISRSYLPAWREFLLASPYGTTIDWALVFGGENKNLNISKEESRQIIEALSLKAFEGKYKVMLIWMPEYLHPNAANGILKILEEPAANTVFLLVSPQKEKLLGTIRSRTQLMRIPPFSDEELSHLLVNEYHVDSAKASQLIPLADGSLRTALQLHEEADVNLHVMFINWMRNCFTHDFIALNTDSEKFATLSKSAQKTLLLYGLEILRDALVSGHNDGQLIRVTGEDKDFVLKFGKTLNTTIIDLLSKQISDAHYHLERNANAKMVFMNLSILFAKSFKR